jgi:hypothetical protein
MNDADLADLLKAIEHLRMGMQVLGRNLPPESVQHLEYAQNGVRKALATIIARHDPQSVQFSESDEDGCVTFTMGLQIDDQIDFGEDSRYPSVAQARPTPPRPKTDKK